MFDDGMSLGQIRREIRALQRRFSRELAVYHLRRITEEISQQWAIAVANKKPKPDPFACVRKIADSKVRVVSHMAFHKYIESCRQNDKQPQVRDMIVALLPWAYKSGLLNNLQWESAARA